MRQGYLLFMGEAPEIGLKFQPSIVPGMPDRLDAHGFADAYNLFDSRDQAESCAEEERRARRHARERGDLSDLPCQDIPMRVRVHDDGRLDILSVDADSFACGGDGIIFSADAASIYRSFGMEPPQRDRALEMAF